MRRLGPEALSGAEKQRRHRERVKTRLAEADRLKARFCAPGDDLPGLRAFYQAVLAELGAKPEECASLSEDIHRLRAQIGELARQSAEAALEALRANRRKARSSLLARLASAKPDAEKD
jgi:DNA repair ATPase RecN